MRCSLSKFSIRSVLSASAVHVRAMSAHAILIGEERASRAMRSHSIELDRHSAAESIGRAVCPIGCKVHSFCKGAWSSDAAPCRNISKQHFVRLLIGFAPCRVRIRRSNNDWITLANRPTEPALVQWISLNPHREWMNFFHLCIMGRQRRHCQSKINSPYSNWPTTKLFATLTTADSGIPPGVNLPETWVVS